MKNWIRVFRFLIVIFFVAWSCDKDRIESFNIDRATLNFVNDSIQFSFIEEESDEHLLEIPVNIIGDSVNRERKFAVEVIDDKTAIAGDNLYEILEGIIPAGKFSGNLILKLRKTPVLDSTSVSLNLGLLETEEFEPGNIESKTIKVIWTNKIVVPDWTWYKYFFTRDPSTAAFRLFIAVTGRTSFTQSEYLSIGPTGAEAMGTAFGDSIRQYNKEHPNNPMLHDDGPKAGEPMIPVL